MQENTQNSLWKKFSQNAFGGSGTKTCHAGLGQEEILKRLTLDEINCLDH